MTTMVATAGGTSARLAIKRPAFQTLWAAYAEVGGMPAADVYALVGGPVLEHYQADAVAYANACALRMSRSFNYGGYAIPRGTLIPGQSIYRVRGDDELPYILRVNDVIHFVKHNWGAPDMLLQPAEAGRLAGRKGLIVMEVSGWLDATGHVTLWDGMQTGDLTDYHDPYSRSYGGSVSLTRIQFWELK